MGFFTKWESKKSRSNRNFVKGIREGAKEFQLPTGDGEYPRYCALCVRWFDTHNEYVKHHHGTHS